MKPAVLVIGYGNELRGDDGAGPAAARAVAGRPGIRAVDVHQLTPELVEEMAEVERVIFVDADASGMGAVHSRRLTPRLDAAPGHALDPAGLLGLTEWLHGHAPPAWLVMVPGERFDLGAGLSPRTAAGVAQAVELIDWLAENP
jgi:hydrogenase maturation protease